MEITISQHLAALAAPRARPATSNGMLQKFCWALPQMQHAMNYQVQPQAAVSLQVAQNQQIIYDIIMHDVADLQGIWQQQQQQQPPSSRNDDRAVAPPSVLVQPDSRVKTAGHTTVRLAEDAAGGLLPEATGAVELVGVSASRLAAAWSGLRTKTTPTPRVSMRKSKVKVKSRRKG